MNLMQCTPEAQAACPLEGSCGDHLYLEGSECSQFCQTLERVQAQKKRTVRDKGTVYDFVTVDMDTDYALQNALKAINDGGYKIVTSWLDSQNGFAVVIFERPAHG